MFFNQIYRAQICKNNILGKVAVRTIIAGRKVDEQIVRDRLLREENRHIFIDRLKRIGKRVKTIDNDKKRNKAGVLMPLCVVNEELSFLFTLRSQLLASHGGQVR